jgi:hypothetical protein
VKARRVGLSPVFFLPAIFDQAHLFELDQSVLDMRALGNSELQGKILAVDAWIRDDPVKDG